MQNRELERGSHLDNLLNTVCGQLGPVLFQLPPNFVKDVEALKAFLADKPAAMRAAFEFRHESWFDDAVFQVLREANAALCVAENEELATPVAATADFGYLRLRREDYTTAHIKKWAASIKEQGGRGPRRLSISSTRSGASDRVLPGKCNWSLASRD